MKQTINFSQFRDAFQKIRPDNFTYEGQKALFEYLEDYEQSCGEEIELDVIALCCDYTEYADLEEFQAAYNYNAEEYKTIEDIEKDTLVLQFGDSFIIQNF